MISPQAKYYVELTPTERAREELNSVRLAIPKQPSMRLTTQRKLHLTVLHLGEVERLIIALEPVTTLSREQLFNEIERFLSQLNTALKPYHDQTFNISPLKYDYVGPKQNILIMVCGDTPNLNDLHSLAYRELVDFLHICGITDLESFLPTCEPLRQARSLLPHVTLVRNYVRKDLNLTLPQELSFRLSPLKAEL